MNEMTCSEFAGFVNHALHQLKREWSQGRRRAPQDFPERMSLDLWWDRFAAVDAPMALQDAVRAEADSLRAKESEYGKRLDREARLQRAHRAM